MPHDLAMSHDRTAMMYAGEVPWHGLGTQLNEPATAELAIEAAGLDYRVELRSLTANDGIPVPKRKAVVRTDSNDVLGVVGTSYQPIQNHQCFGFLDSVVADGRMRYHTAGALGKGEKIWMLAKLPGEIRIKDSVDVTEQYLLLSNSHDGSSSLRVFFTPIRVVCANTLGAAERRGKGQGISVIHKGNLASKVEEERLRVTEFKTSGRAYSELEAETSLQPTFYSNAVHEAYGRPVEVDYAVLVKTKTPRLQRLNAPRNEEASGRLGDIIENIEHAVRANIYYPVENPLNCSSCPFRQPCREWSKSDANDSTALSACSQEELAC